MDLKDKVVLVTGGAIGIGEAIVREFSNQRAKVVINYNRSSIQANELVKELEAKGKKAIAIKANVGLEDEVKNMFKEAISKFGQIDILVNNAGYSPVESFLEGDNKLWMDQFQNNTLSVVNCSREFGNLNKDREGKIINISSIFGFNDKGWEGMMQYCASKAAVNNITMNLAKLLAPKILVNAIAPGYVYTPQWDEKSEEVRNDCKNQPLIKRFIQPEEIADGVIFLAKNDSVTGTILLMDGGLALK